MKDIVEPDGTEAHRLWKFEGVGSCLLQDPEFIDEGERFEALERNLRMFEKVIKP